MELRDLFPEDLNQQPQWGPEWWAVKERREKQKDEDALLHERLILSMCDEARVRGEAIPQGDLARERLAWERVHGGRR
jgi:hypothetical protein